MDTTGRDLGLSRLSRITRWAVGGAVVLTGAFSVLVAHARPGRAQPASTSTPTPTPTVAPSTGDSTLQPPIRPPSAASGGGMVTSGAS
ncbi:MAG: hypothetical protein M3083_07235 [Actinomycetota bacterium]|nr:hypothetical protein [Actinomycetota bacterium]